MITKATRKPAKAVASISYRKHAADIELLLMKSIYSHSAVRLYTQHKKLKKNGDRPTEKKPVIDVLPT